MPGCAGDYLNPIPGWVEKGLTCEDCAWLDACKEYYEERVRGKFSPLNEAEIVTSKTVE